MLKFILKRTWPVNTFISLLLWC